MVHMIYAMPGPGLLTSGKHFLEEERKVGEDYIAPLKRG